MKYDQMSYKQARKYMKNLTTEERIDLQRKLYEKLCAKEIADIPKNIKDTCVVCGKHIGLNHSHYEKYGNYCVDCDLEVTIKMSIEMNLFKSHKGSTKKTANKLA
jgi:RNA polymerase-binding transcription factor DksA